jgi:hypothetical protein
MAKFDMRCSGVNVATDSVPGMRFAEDDADTISFAMECGSDVRNDCCCCWAAVAADVAGVVAGGGAAAVVDVDDDVN